VYVIFFYINCFMMFVRGVFVLLGLVFILFGVIASLGWFHSVRG
jgi:hypothetical protein